MNQPEPFILVQDLSHTYLRGTPLETQALDHVSLEVMRGEIVGLMGPTGSGKSTLLQHLCGLIHPQSGHVRVDGADLADPATDFRQVRRRIGMVFQAPEDQLFERYVGDDVAFGPRNMRLDRDTIRQRVRTALDWVGLDFATFKDRLTLSLSGGERRKAALAGVLAMEPLALLLDEPTAGLDPLGREELLALLKRWQQEQGLTIVLSSHNMDDLACLADRIYVLNRGRNALTGSVREVFAQGPQLRELGLEVPTMTAVLEALADCGLPVRSGALSITEVADAIQPLLAG
jgi:energy-coupling factor transporter ATPase